MADKPNHKTTVGEFLRSRSGHIEMFAAAYLKQTGLDPTKTKMIEKRETTDTGMTVTYWFEENTGVLTRIEQLEAELAEWKQNAVNLARSYLYSDFGDSNCIHCGYIESKSQHDDDCPIKEHRELLKKYNGRLEDK